MSCSTGQHSRASPARCTLTSDQADLSSGTASPTTRKRSPRSALRTRRSSSRSQPETRPKDDACSCRVNWSRSLESSPCSSVKTQWIRRRRPATPQPRPIDPPFAAHATGFADGRTQARASASPNTAMPAAAHDCADEKGARGDGTAISSRRRSTRRTTGKRPVASIRCASAGARLDDTTSTLFRAVDLLSGDRSFYGLRAAAKSAP